MYGAGADKTREVVLYKTTSRTMNEEVIGSKEERGSMN